MPKIVEILGLQIWRKQYFWHPPSMFLKFAVVDLQKLWRRSMDSRCQSLGRKSWHKSLSPLFQPGFKHQKESEVTQCSGGFHNRVWQIFGYLNIFEYFLIQIFVSIIFTQMYSDIHSYHFFIRIYSDIHSCNLFIQIYSDIRSCNFFIRIYLDICSCQQNYECHTLSELTKHELNSHTIFFFGNLSSSLVWDW